MKQFIIRTVSITFIIVLLSLVLHFLVYPAFNLVPWTWGSELLHKKRNAILSSSGEFNNLVIGSSRVYREVNPLVLDSVTAHHGIKTYNLGINWLFAPESFYVFDQLVTADNLRLKCVVMELSKIRSIDYANLHTARTIYWYNWPNYVFTIRAVADSRFPFHEKIATIVAHTVSYTDQLINLGFITEAFHFDAVTSGFMPHPLPIGTQGYLPLNEGEENTAEENIMARRREFLKDTSSVTRRLEISIAQFDKFETQPILLNNYNHYYARELNKMIEKYRDKGIHLVFLLSPRIDRKQYDELIPLFNQLPVMNRINLSDGRKFPAFYQAAYSFDETHLNQHGADLYSAELGSRLSELLKSAKSTAKR